MLERLPYARRLELESREPRSRRASLCGTALLFAVAGRLGYGAVEPAAMKFPEGEKPRVAGGPYFSISHTARRVVCAASRDCDLGVDHEEYTGDEPPARLRRWTAVEATLKAAGAGLKRVHAVEVDPALRSARLDATVYQLQTLDLGPGVVACLAARSVPDAIEVQGLEGVGS